MNHSKNNSASFEIPPLDYPSPAQVDEQLGNQINQRLLAWVKGVGIFDGKLEKMQAENYGRFAMLCHPDAQTPEHLMLAAKCFAALFALDDQYCDDEQSGSNPRLLGSRLSLALTTLDKAYLNAPYDLALQQALEGDPVLRGLQGYMKHLNRFGTPSQSARVRLETVAMFVSMSAEATWRIEQSLPPVWEYLAHRQVNSFLPCIALIDVIGGYELDTDTYFSTPVREAVTLAASATIIANDVYSGPKENVSEASDFKLPWLLAREQNCSLQEGLWLTADIHNKIIQRYKTKEHELLKHASPALKRFLDGVRAWLAGNNEWHRSSARYKV
ncbi:terpene synthase family protein [Pseudomonas sp. L1(2025)]|uniref:terpene synthase family protein n=1 Tax=Pseudomonas sp. L1(2025) TaxID=3449429 RepID=UPI003F693F51